MVRRSSLKGGKNSLMVRKEQGHPTQPNQTTQSPQAESSIVFPLYWVKRKRKRVTRNGPDFTNEKHIGAGLCSSKVTKKASKGLYFMLAVTSGHTAVRQNHGHDAGQEHRNAPTSVASMSNGVAYLCSIGKDLSCGTTRATGCTYKSMLPSGDQSVVATANDESLQVRVRKGTPPKGRST